MPTLDEIQHLLLGGGDLLLRIVRGLGSSTVALFAISYEKGVERLKLGGTGTLAIGDKRYGILTAAHVWDALKSGTKVGITMTEKIDHRFAIDVNTIVPTVLRTAVWNEHGPDLAFLRIPAEHIGQIEAYHAFEDLEKLPKHLGAESLEAWVATGIPGELGCFTTTHASVTLNGTLVNPRYLSGAPDYYEFEVDTSGLGVPKSYGGFSGGGLWRVPVYWSPSTGKVDWAQRLKGVMFWQLPEVNGRRTIRCHGPDSILSLLKLVKEQA